MYSDSQIYLSLNPNKNPYIYHELTLKKPLENEDYFSES